MFLDKWLWKWLFEEMKVKDLDKTLVTCKEEQAYEDFYKQRAKFRCMQSEMS